MQPVTQQHIPETMNLHFYDSYRMQSFALNGIKWKEISITAMLPLHKSIYLQVFKNYDWQHINGQWLNHTAIFPSL
jgi:hypothetical protein